MEPRLLANVNGTLVPTATPTRPASFVSPTKEFLNLSTPASREAAAPVVSVTMPETPGVGAPAEDRRSDWDSPTTPYFMSKGAELLQQTCPPKQLMQPLFPLSGCIADQPDEAVRKRLVMARRKSLQWAPKVKSPLGRAVSYEK